MSNSLDPDQARHFVRPNLRPDCLQRLSADGASRRRVKITVKLWNILLWATQILHISTFDIDQVFEHSSCKCHSVHYVPLAAILDEVHHTVCCRDTFLVYVCNKIVIFLITQDDFRVVIKKVHLKKSNITLESSYFSVSQIINISIYINVIFLRFKLTRLASFIIYWQTLKRQNLDSTFNLCLKNECKITILIVCLRVFICEQSLTPDPNIVILWYIVCFFVFWCWCCRYDIFLSSWVEPVLSRWKSVLLKDKTQSLQWVSTVGMWTLCQWATVQNNFCRLMFFLLQNLSYRNAISVWGHSGSVVECLTRDLGAAGSSLTSVTVLCPWARHIYPCLVLVQPRKTRPDITEKLLTGT